MINNNPLLSQSPVRNNHGDGGGGGSALNRNGGISINSVAELCEAMLKKANANLADAMKEAQDQADTQTGQQTGGGASDNLSLMQVQQAQGNVTAINQEGSSIIQSAAESAKNVAQAIK